MRLKAITNSGMQGVELNSLLLAREFGIQTKGWTTSGFRRQKRLLSSLNLRECSCLPGIRLYRNIALSNLTILFVDEYNPFSLDVRQVCCDQVLPLMIIILDVKLVAEAFADNFNQVVVPNFRRDFTLHVTGDVNEVRLPLVNDMLTALIRRVNLQ